jgi:chemotaxis protein histidine kinase CheA
MSVTFSKPANRLARRVGKIGIGRDEAVARALSNVESVREETLAKIDEHIESLTQVMAADKPPNPSVLQEGYKASNSIAGTAGVFGYEGLGQAAYSLCDLICHFERTGTWNKAAVKAHLNAMDVLRRRPPEVDNEESLQLVRSLGAMTEHMQRTAARALAGDPSADQN